MVAPKTQASSAAAILGLLLSVRAFRVRCPALKAAVIMRDAAATRAAVAAGEPLEMLALERLVGRLANIAQVVLVKARARR